MCVLEGFYIVGNEAMDHLYQSLSELQASLLRAVDAAERRQLVVQIRDLNRLIRVRARRLEIDRQNSNVETALALLRAQGRLSPE